MIDANYRYENFQHMGKFFDYPPKKCEISGATYRAHPSAQIGVFSRISHSCLIGQDVTIEEHCSLEWGAQMLPFSRLECGVRVGIKSSIGLNSNLHMNVTVASHCFLGDYVRVEEGAEIGHFTKIGDGSRILKRVKLLPYSVVPPQIMVNPSPDGVPFVTADFSLPSILPHPIMACSDGRVAIGCQTHSVSHWTKCYGQIAKHHLISEKTMPLYRTQFNAAKAWIKWVTSARRNNEFYKQHWGVPERRKAVKNE